MIRMIAKVNVLAQAGTSTGHQQFSYPVCAYNSNMPRAIDSTKRLDCRAPWTETRFGDDTCI